MSESIREQIVRKIKEGDYRIDVDEKDDTVKAYVTVKIDRPLEYITITINKVEDE